MRAFSNGFLSSSSAHRSLRACLGALFLLSSLFALSGCLSRSLTGITIQPGTGLTTVTPGTSAQFKAMATYTESGHATTAEDITSQVTWSSTIPAVAAVNSTGLATGIAPGQTNIVATVQGAFGQLSATSNIVVSASSSGGSATRALTTVNVIPNSQTLEVTGETAQMIAMGSYSASPASADLTSQATWSSSNPSVAQVNSSGLVTATGTGTATITALASSPDGSVVSGTGTVTVATAQTARTLTALNVSPGSQTLTTIGQTAQLIAVGTYNASPLSQNLTSSVSWVSSDPGVATVNSSGLVTGQGAGAATITAIATASDGTTTSAGSSVTVEQGAGSSTRTLTSLAIIPVSQGTKAIGETGQFLAIGTYNLAPVTVDMTNQVTWLSSDVEVATINAAGLATSMGGGETTITALFAASDGSAITASATLQAAASGTVTLPTLAIYGAGTGSGTVTGPDAISCSYSGPSTVPGSGAGSGALPGAGCTGTFPLGTVVTLTEVPGNSSVFDGWSSNCTPVAGHPSECTITMNNNESVGAIFDPQ